MIEVTNMLIYGQPASGKSTLAKAIKENHRNTAIVDGDELRMASVNTSFDKQGRERNIDNAIMVAKMFNANGMNVVLALVAPYAELRKKIVDNLWGIKTVYLHYDKTNLKTKRPRGENWVSDFEQDYQTDLWCNTGIETIDETFAKINQLWLREHK